MTIQLPNQEGEEFDQHQRLKQAWDPEAGVCKMSKNRGFQDELRGKSPERWTQKKRGRDCN